MTLISAVSALYENEYVSVYAGHISTYKTKLSAKKSKKKKKVRE